MDECERQVVLLGDMRIVPSYFGDRYAVEDVLSPGASAIVVGTLSPGAAIELRRILLPHQLYVTTVEKLKAEAGERSEVYVAQLVTPWVRVA